MEINLERYGDELVYSPEICLYNGESLKINLGSVGLDIGSFKATINGSTLGVFNGVSFGVHSSKLIEGVNNITIKPINSDQVFTLKIVRRLCARGTNFYEDEINRIFKKLDLIEKELDDFNNFKEEINAERSGY